jgi:hypothetical protein
VRKFLILALVLAFFPSAALAESSTICLWGLLAEGHAQMEACGDSLGPDGEARYATLRAATEAAVVANAKLATDQTRDSVRAGLAATDRGYHDKLAADPDALKADLCLGPDYGQVKSIVEELTAASTLDRMLAGLKKPRDPFAGECL